MKPKDSDNKIEALEYDYLYIQKSSIPKAGDGLFAAIDIYRDEIISIFDGEILSDQEAEQRAKNGDDQYFIVLLNGQIMDSKNTHCFAKYANDAKGSQTSLFNNNAKITLNENNQVCLQAIKKIKAGEEILVSYGKKYWAKHST